MSVCLFLYSFVEIGWNKDLRISTCGNEDSKINIVPWDAELLKLHFLWIWVLHFPALPLGTSPSCTASSHPPYSLQTVPQFPLSCCLHERLGALQTHACACWPTPSQQKWYGKASCCSFSCRRTTLFNPLPFSSCQCLQNLQEFNYLQGFYLSIELDWNKPMNLQMVKEEKVWQTGPACKLHFFRRVVQKTECRKVWDFEKYKSVWTVTKIVWLWSKRE